MTLLGISGGELVRVVFTYDHYWLLSRLLWILFVHPNVRDILIDTIDGRGFLEQLILDIVVLQDYVVSLILNASTSILLEER